MSKSKVPPQENQTKSPLAEMSVWQHVGELRKRLFRCLIAMVVTIIISFLFGEQLIEFIAQPIGGIDKLVSIEVTENVSVFMRVTLLSGFILALPFILYQLVGFILPGLTPKEKRGVLIAIPFATVLFVAGVSFAYFIMLPAALPFLISFIGITTTPRLANYFAFVTNLMFWIGLSFEIPLVVYVLAKLHLVTASGLAKQWRIAIVVIAIISAFATPTPDPINMSLLMIPLSLLFLLSIFLAWLANRGENTSEQTATES